MSDLSASVRAKLDAWFKTDGWLFDDDASEWRKVIVVDDLSSRIGPVPMRSILDGKCAAVYGTGAAGIARFIEEAITSDLIDNLVELVDFTDEELDWLDDEDNFENVTSTLQLMLAPTVTVTSVEACLAA